MIGKTYSSKSSFKENRTQMKLADDAKILLAGEGLRIHPGKRELDLSIRTGEIIGLYGLVGFLDQLRAGIF
jgi:ABC-type sugar transport system ATPase subunit